MKKRWFSFLMALCMCVTLIPAGAVSAPLLGVDIMPGDIDGDGKVTMHDAALLERCLKDDLELTPEQEQAADMDGDGSLTVRDVLLIQRYVGGGDSEPEPDSDFGWSFDDGTLTLYGPGDMTYDHMDSPWFAYEDRIFHLVVESGVTSIGEEAFYRYDALTDITFKGDGIAIGEKAFMWCDALTDITFKGDGIAIGEKAFMWCDALTSVTFSGDVSAIGYEAFESCDDLTSVTFSGDVGSIGALAFDDCNALTSVTFSGDVGSIGNSAFLSCGNLTNVTFAGDVGSIGNWAFQYCDSLTSVTFSGDVGSIGEDAFMLCKALTSVTFSGDVGSIGESAFMWCKALNSVTFSGDVGSIGSAAFSGCDALTTFTIPASVTHIGSNAFWSCDNLTDIYYGGSKAQWEKLVADTSNFRYRYITVHFGDEQPEDPDEPDIPDNPDPVPDDPGDPDKPDPVPDDPAPQPEDPGDTDPPKPEDPEPQPEDPDEPDIPDNPEPEPDDPDKIPVVYSVSEKGSGSISGPAALSRDEGALTVEIVPNDGYYLSSLTLNGEEMIRGEYYDSSTFSMTVPGGVSEIYVVATFEEIPNNDVKFTVTFDANGGTGFMYDVTVKQGETLTLPENRFTAPSGKRFEGWDVNGAEWQPGVEIFVAADTIIKAVWEDIPVVSYTVKFDANGGSVRQTSKSVTPGAAYGTLPTPTRNNYTFDGWFTSASGGTQVTSNTTVNLSADQTLYAHWTATRSYTVTFDANGGTGTPSPQEKEENVPLTLSSLKPSKTYILQYNASGGSVSPASKNVSCTFENWNTQKNGGGTSYASGGNYTANADVTLYAQWTNPSAGALATPSRSGYNFTGWFTSATGGTQISESSAVTENLTLYAHWSDSRQNVYNMGEETYSFENYGDSDSFGGHCFGMSMTSAGYYNNLLDIGKIGGNANTPLYSFGKTPTVKKPICYYQSKQGRLSANAIVAGGSCYLYGIYNIDSDWQEVVNYVRNHNYDNTGLLQIGFRKDGVGGHAINFLRYENVNGQDRIYAYDNNFPSQETYFYRDSSGSVRQTPVQTFSGAIDCIALRDCRRYFNSVGDFDATHVLYMAKEAATVQGYAYSYMEGDFSDEEYVMYEIPANQNQVIIIPNRDYANFVYMDTAYSFGEITDETCGKFTFASMNEGALVANADFQIFEDNSISHGTDLTVSDITVKQNAVTVKFSGEVSKAMSVSVCAYSKAGKMLACAAQTVNSGTSANLSLTTAGADYVKAFLLDVNNSAPLCNPARKNLS